MSCVWGNKISVTIFGESHGPKIGAVLGNLPAGEIIDEEKIAREMARRAPGGGAFATPRKESDRVFIVSGLLNGKTTGAPLCALLDNANARSGDYDPARPRPGHADLAAHMKYGGFQDFRGGGHFSGRLTAPLTFAGAVAKQILYRRGIVAGAHIQNIGGVSDKAFSEISKELLFSLSASPFPLLDESVKEKMESAMESAKQEGDSVGGIIEGAALGLPFGLGDPFFSSAESVISSMMFSIPAVKGIEFGSGFSFASMKGSEANDPIQINDGKIVTLTNHNGGINGGITNSMPLVFRVVIKPTPSIQKTQQTIDLFKKQNTSISVKGRHDPCIVLRAVPVIEAGLSLSLLDMLL